MVNCFLDECFEPKVLIEKANGLRFDAGSGPLHSLKELKAKNNYERSAVKKHFLAQTYFSVPCGRKFFGSDSHSLREFVVPPKLCG